MYKPHAFVAIYSGDTIASAKLIAASACPRVVDFVTDHLLHDPDSPLNAEASDVVSNALNAGRCQALQKIAQASLKEGLGDG